MTQSVRTFHFGICGSRPSGEIQNEAVTEAAQSGTLQIMVDWSGSCVRQALEEAWHTVKNELPKIVETYHVTDVSISSFDEDGWSPTRLKELPMPVLNLPARQKPNPTEWDSFPQHPRGRTRRRRRRVAQSENGRAGSVSKGSLRHACPSPIPVGVARADAPE